MNRTGVPHSRVLLIWIDNDLRASATAMSTGELVGDGLVEGPTEFLRGVIGDLVLHRNDRRRPAPDERRRRAREKVVGAAARTLARVQHRQPQRIVVTQQPAKLGRRHPHGGPVLVDQGDDAFIDRRIEAAMTGEVEDVPLVATKSGLQLARRGRIEPLQLHEAARLEPGRCLLDPRPLTLDVQRRQSGRARDHAEDPQRSASPSAASTVSGTSM